MMSGQSRQTTAHTKACRWKEGNNLPRNPSKNFSGNNPCLLTNFLERLA